MNLQQLFGKWAACLKSHIEKERLWGIMASDPLNSLVGVELSGILSLAFIGWLFIAEQVLWKTESVRVFDLNLTLSSSWNKSFAKFYLSGRRLILISLVPLLSGGSQCKRISGCSSRSPNRSEWMLVSHLWKIIIDAISPKSSTWDYCPKKSSNWDYCPKKIQAAPGTVGQKRIGTLCWWAGRMHYKIPSATYPPGARKEKLLMVFFFYHMCCIALVL